MHWVHRMIGMHTLVALAALRRMDACIRCMRWLHWLFLSVAWTGYVGCIGFMLWMGYLCIYTYIYIYIFIYTWIGAPAIYRYRADTDRYRYRYLGCPSYIGTDIGRPLTDIGTDVCGVVCDVPWRRPISLTDFCVSSAYRYRCRSMPDRYRYRYGGYPPATCYLADRYR